MHDAKKLIDELAAHIESGKQVDFGNILEIHAQIERLHDTLKAKFGESGEPARAAREADLLIEKIILEYVANASTALRDLGRIVASMNRSAITRTT